jgi:hypothetical protein
MRAAIRSEALDGLRLDTIRPVLKIRDLVTGADIAPESFKTGSKPGLNRIELASDVS